jgi:hypothetical protein
MSRPASSACRASASAGLGDGEITVDIDIRAVKSGGFAESAVRIVSGNARTLKFRDSSFEDR